MLYRDHKGSLRRSMETSREIAATKDALAVEASLYCGRSVAPSEIAVSPYCYDSRIMWDSHIVEVDGFGPIGFVNGPLESD